MKKLIFLMSIGLIVLTGCSKENTTDQIEQQTADVVFVYNADSTNPTWEANFDVPTKVNGSGSTTTATRANNGNSGHTHGNTEFFTFSGTQNNGGTHGSATVSLGPSVYTLETECVMVEGNEAVYGGIITEAINPPPFAGQVGDYIYFKVFDNGQGSNANPDQFHGIIRFSGSSLCGVVTPSSGAWPPTFFGLFSLIVDIEAPGSVKVNN